MDNFIGEQWTSHIGVLWTTNVGLDNRRFAVAAEPDTAFIPWGGTSLAELLCVQESRVVA